MQTLTAVIQACFFHREGAISTTGDLDGPLPAISSRVTTYKMSGRPGGCLQIHTSVASVEQRATIHLLASPTEGSYRSPSSL